MHKVQTVLRAAGMDFENVVWMNVYLTDTTTRRPGGCVLEDDRLQPSGPNGV